MSRSIYLNYIHPNTFSYLLFFHRIAGKISEACDFLLILRRSTIFFYTYILKIKLFNVLEEHCSHVRLYNICYNLTRTHIILNKFNVNIIKIIFFRKVLTLNPLYASILSPLFFPRL